MLNVTSLIQEAKAHIKAGRKKEARQLLEQVIAVDERNEEAWLWLSGCVETPEDQLVCLENVLEINPKNEKARKGLERLQSRPNVAPPASAPANPPVPGSLPAAPTRSTSTNVSPFIGDWSAYGEEASQPGGWGGSSVDWGRSGGGAAVGSGRNVAQPSAEEYDSWMASLPLGGNSPSPADTGTLGGSGFDAPPAAPGYSGNNSGSMSGSSSGSQTDYSDDSFSGGRFSAPSFDNAGFSGFDQNDQGFDQPYDQSYDQPYGQQADQPYGQPYGQQFGPSYDQQGGFDSFGSGGQGPVAGAGYGQETEAEPDTGFASFGSGPESGIIESSFGAPSTPDFTDDVSLEYLDDQPPSRPSSRPSSRTSDAPVTPMERPSKPASSGFAGLGAQRSAFTGAGSAEPRRAPTSTAKLFAQIPEEIQLAQPGERSSVGAVGVVVLLAVVNLISALFLLSNLLS